MTIVSRTPSYPTTTLAGVLRAVRDQLAALGWTGELLMGKRYIGQEGRPPRILVVPDRGTWEGVTGINKGQTASVAIGCTVYVWGDETVDDFDRYDAADSIGDLFLNTLVRVAQGRITGDSYEDASPQNIVARGEEYRLRFVYRRGVRRNDELFKFNVPTPAPSPPDFAAPPNAVADDLSVNISVEPSEQ